MTELTKWDYQYLEHAVLASKMSKDPSTKVGAVIVDQHGHPKSWGCNGFAKGFEDTPERWNDREFKYRHTIHAELNAVLHCDTSLQGCTVYITHPPCQHCISMLKQKGISRVIALDAPDDMKARWDFSESITVAEETWVVLQILDKTVEDYSWLLTS